MVVEVLEASEAEAASPECVSLVDTAGIGEPQTLGLTITTGKAGAGETSDPGKEIYNGETEVDIDQTKS